MCTRLRSDSVRTRQPAFLLLLWVLGLGVAQAGIGDIVDGIQKYRDAEFEAAIGSFQRALTGIDRGDSTIVYCYVAACNSKLGSPEKRDESFEKALDVNAAVQLPEELRGESDLADALRRVWERRYSRTLSVTSTPTGAEVSIDGSPKGQTPQVFRALQQGRTYRVKVQRTGYYTFETQILVERDTMVAAEMLKLPDTVIETNRVYVRTDPRSYSVGLGVGASLGLGSFLVSVLFNDMAINSQKSHTIADDPDTAAMYGSRVAGQQALSDVFYYASYPLMAVGFYAGLKLGEAMFPGYASLIDEDSPTRVYCAVNKNLDISLGVRRSIW